MTPVDRQLSAAFCAVPAFIRVEPAISSAPVSSRIGMSDTSPSRLPRVVEQPDRERTRGAGMFQGGDGERRAAAGGQRHHTSAGPTASSCSARRAAPVSSSAPSAACSSARSPPAIHRHRPLIGPRKGRGQFGRVLRGDAARGAGAGIDQPTPRAPAAAPRPRWPAPAPVARPARPRSRPAGLRRCRRQGLRPTRIRCRRSGERRFGAQWRLLWTRGP